jgi:hypothetical protein
LTISLLRIKAPKAGPQLLVIATCGLFLAAAIGVTGCTSYRAVLPEVSRQPISPSAQAVGLAKVKDARSNTQVGSLGIGGAITMTSGTELPEYIFSYAENQLGTRAFRAVVAADPTDPAYKTNRFDGNTVVFTLESVNVTMTDTLITPGRSTASLRGQIFDARGNQIYSQVASGSYSESFPLISGPQATSEMTGKLAAEACSRAVLAIIVDPNFLRALRAPQSPAVKSTAAAN